MVVVVVHPDSKGGTAHRGGERSGRVTRTCDAGAQRRAPTAKGQAAGAGAAVLSPLARRAHRAPASPTGQTSRGSKLTVRVDVIATNIATNFVIATNSSWTGQNLKVRMSGQGPGQQPPHGGGGRSGDSRGYAGGNYYPPGGQYPSSSMGGDYGSGRYYGGVGDAYAGGTMPGGNRGTGMGGGPGHGTYGASAVPRQPVRVRVHAGALHARVARRCPRLSAFLQAVCLRAHAIACVCVCVCVYVCVTRALCVPQEQSTAPMHLTSQQQRPQVPADAHAPSRSPSHAPTRARAV